MHVSCHQEQSIWEIRVKMIARIKRLINTMMSAHDKQVMESHSRFVCRLPARGYGTTEFAMNDDRRAALVAAGRCATSAYLDGLEDGA